MSRVALDVLRDGVHKMRTLALAALVGMLTVPLYAQQSSAPKGAGGKTGKPRLPVPPKNAPLTPLSDRERAM